MKVLYVFFTVEFLHYIIASRSLKKVHHTGLKVAITITHW